jgi:hypothetical protein
MGDGLNHPDCVGYGVKFIHLVISDEDMLKWIIFVLHIEHSLLGIEGFRVL